MIDKYNPFSNPIKITCQTAESLPLEKLINFQGKLKTLTKENRAKIVESICIEGFMVPFFVWNDSGECKILDGHQRGTTLLWMQDKGWEIPPLPVVYVDADSEHEARRKLLKISSQYGEFDLEELGSWLTDFEEGFEDSLRLVNDQLELNLDFTEINLTDSDDTIPEQFPQITKLGDLWELGEHRLLCGDSLNNENIIKVMDGKKAELSFNDPPYGMKKEKDGVLNDNLNFEDLLDFNKKWIELSFSHLKDIGSWYCWGIDEPLMDIHVNILKPMIKAERITFRNLITWNKGSAQGRMSEAFNKYPVADEKCLFVMAGVQGFNNNSNNYFEGWEPIREYINSELKKTGWTVKKTAAFFGFHTRMVDHWKSKSQFSLIKEDQYLRLREESKNEFFMKQYIEILEEYDNAKIEFYNSRAYFDNTHESMSNVWEFPQCKGEEKEKAGNHATPKPLALCCRTINSSSRKNDLILDLFIGSGSVIVAAEKTGRRCYGLELKPINCDKTVNRYINWCDENGKTPVIKLNGKIYHG